MITGMPVESPVRGDAHAGFGGRAGETDQPKDRHRAPARPYVFRFNRRQSNARGLLFYRLLQNAVALRKINQEVIVLRPKPQETKQRGRKRTRPYSTTAITNTPTARGMKRAATP